MRMSNGLFIVTVLVIGFLAPSAFCQHEVGYRVEISHADTVGLMRALDQAGFDVAGRNAAQGTVEVVATQEEVSRLEAFGLSLRIIGQSGGKGIPSGYTDFSTILSMLANWETTYPSIADNVNLGQSYGPGATCEDRPLHALKISDNVQSDEDEPTILIVSCHHAREIVTPELALYIIDQLLTGYGSDPDITRWIDENEIWIAPVWNPDGLVYCWTVYDYWRKNRKPLPGGNFGIDLNRNYPYGWYGPYSGSTSYSSDTYKGPSPASEEETETMLDWARDRRFAKVLDFHSSGREVLYTYYETSAMPSQIENWFSSKATTFSQELGYGGWQRKPSAEGEHYQWELNELGSFAFLVETHTSFQPSYSSAVAEAQLIWPGVQWFIDHEIPLYGHVTEAGTGLPLEADLDVAGLNYTAGDIRRSGGPFGRFHYFMPAGSYNVTVSASGYPSRTVPVTIVAGESTVLETQLGTDPILTITGRVVLGGTLDMDFDWPAGAGQNFMNAASWVNTGFNFPNSMFFPIGMDGLFMTTVGSLPGWSGTLDGSGHASATLDIPSNPSFAGRTVYMAFFTYVSDPYNPTNASAAVSLTLES